MGKKGVQETNTRLHLMDVLWNLKIKNQCQIWGGREKIEIKMRRVSICGEEKVGQSSECDKC